MSFDIRAGRCFSMGPLLFPVMPAQAGIQVFWAGLDELDPGLRRVTIRETMNP